MNGWCECIYVREWTKKIRSSLPHFFRSFTGRSGNASVTVSAGQRGRRSVERALQLHYLRSARVVLLEFLVFVVVVWIILLVVVLDGVRWWRTQTTTTEMVDKLKIPCRYSKCVVFRY